MASANNIYVIGGSTPDFDGSSSTEIILDVVEKYNPYTEIWEVDTSIPQPRYNSGAGSLNGNLYVVGGVVSDNVPVSSVYKGVPGVSP